MTLDEIWSRRCEQLRAHYDSAAELTVAWDKMMAADEVVALVEYQAKRVVPRPLRLEVHPDEWRGFIVTVEASRAMSRGVIWREMNPTMGWHVFDLAVIEDASVPVGAWRVA